jgi:hypothetical protein
MTVFFSTSKDLVEVVSSRKMRLKIRGLSRKGQDGQNDLYANGKIDKDQETA